MGDVQAREVLRLAMTSIGILQILVFFGLILSLIIAIFLKRPAPEGSTSS